MQFVPLHLFSDVAQVEATQDGLVQAEATQGELAQVIEATQGGLVQAEATQGELVQAEATQGELVQAEATEGELVQVEATQGELAQEMPSNAASLLPAVTEIRDAKGVTWESVDGVTFMTSPRPNIKTCATCKNPRLKKP